VIQKYTWIFTLLIALGGLFQPRLGLLVIPIMLTLIIMSAVKGRFWCGNFCSHGSLFDHVLGPISRQRKIPTWLKAKYTSALVFMLFGYGITRRLAAAARLWGTSGFWDRLGFVFVASYIMVLVVGGSLAVFIRPRTWCQFCPMGTMQKLSYQLGTLLGTAARHDRKITISDPAKCRACAKCARACPMELSPYLGFEAASQFDDPNCIRCGKCAAACPFSLLSLGTVLEA
jgi:ferredoxin-type protein NapH